MAKVSKEVFDVGLFKRLMIVDSTPILHLPPSKTYLIFDPNSSITSDA